MEVEFDPLKREATLANRGIDFADAARVLDGPDFTFEDTRFDYPERRFVTYGLLDGRLVAVVWAEAGTARRIISMRKANDKEKRRYANRLG